MIIEINENIKIWREYAPFDLKNYEASLESAESNHVLARMGLQKERIAIRNRWFDVLSASELIRKRNPSDGYYRASSEIRDIFALRA